MKTINNFHVSAVLKTVVALLFELSQGGELIKNSVLGSKNLVNNFF
jgi:hypothetical protein